MSDKTETEFANRVDSVIKNNPALKLLSDSVLSEVRKGNQPQVHKTFMMIFWDQVRCNIEHFENLK